MSSHLNGGLTDILTYIRIARHRRTQHRPREVAMMIQPLLSVSEMTAFGGEYPSGRVMSDDMAEKRRNSTMPEDGAEGYEKKEEEDGSPTRDIIQKTERGERREVEGFQERNREQEPFG